MVNYQTQDKFRALAELLREVVQDKYSVRLSIWQANNAHRFEIHSERPALPFFHVEFTNESLLVVTVSDGIHVPAFRAFADCHHCVVSLPDGWRFDTDRIVDIVCRLLDFGAEMFELGQQGKRQEAS